MNIALWIVQGLLGAIFLAAGGLKSTQNKAALIEKKLAWAEDFSPSQIKLIGIAEFLCGAGLIAPWALRIVPVLTPIAAVGLAVIMIGAAMTHRRRNEPSIPQFVLAALAVFVAVGRFRG